MVTESGALLIDQDFRQVGLIRNPKITATDSDFTGNAASTLDFFHSRVEQLHSLMTHLLLVELLEQKHMSLRLILQLAFFIIKRKQLVLEHFNLEKL
jgi:hypothetical protein